MQDDKTELHKFPALISIIFPQYKLQNSNSSDKPLLANMVMLGYWLGNND